MNWPASGKYRRSDLLRWDGAHFYAHKWVALRNGFSDARDYYERTAGARQMPGVTVPTLMLHASNDPWIPVQPYLSAQQ